MFTLENGRGDCIRKENGKWGLFRNPPSAEFKTENEAKEALLLIVQEWNGYTKDINIVEW